MESPCIQVCVIDEASGLCAGCYRSLGEIAGWSNLGPDRRRQIIAELSNRAGMIGQIGQRRRG